METIGFINRPIEILLHISGLWTGSPYAPFCKLYWTFSFGITIVLHFQYIIKYLQDIDLPELIENFTLCLTNTFVFFKLIIFWFNQRTLEKLLAVMAMDWKKNTDIDTHARIMTKKANLSHLFSTSLVLFYAGSVIFYTIAIFIINIVNNESSEQIFIIKMDLPFNSDRRFVHEFIIFNQIVQLLMCSTADAALNALLVAMILHTSGQIEILCGYLSNLFPKKEKCNLQTNIKTIVKQHQDIIAFSMQIEKLYSYIAMVQFFSDTLIICGLGFILVTVSSQKTNYMLTQFQLEKDIENFFQNLGLFLISQSIGKPNTWVIILKTCIFYFSINLEAFTYCFIGEYLSVKSKAIGDAAYNSLWYESNSKDSQIILFLIMRSQNHLSITIGKITDLSLNRFTDIIKASASYISVLLAMY